MTWATPLEARTSVWMTLAVEEGLWKETPLSVTEAVSVTPLTVTTSPEVTSAAKI
jgi:hypothetical protein